MSARQTPPGDSRVQLPAWARVADGLGLALTGVAVFVALIGGFRLHLAGVRFSVTSAPRLAAAAVIILLVRHAFCRQRTLYGRAWEGVLRLRDTEGARRATLRWVGRRIAYVVAVVAFLVSVASFHHPNAGFTSLIFFGSQFEPDRLPAVLSVPHVVDYQSSGYDGQFYAQLAVDPLLRDRRLDKALDTPPYRARRILFAWTAYLLGLGRPAWILNVYALQNVIAWLLLAWLLLRWFPPTAARNFLPWFGCLFGVGIATSFRFALLEGPSMVIIVLAVRAVERNRSWLAAGLLGLAGLGRETNVLASGLLVEAIPRTVRDALRLAGQACLVALPFLLWAAYVRSVYPTFNFSNPDSFSLPLSGYAGKWAEIISDMRTSGWHSFARFNIGLMIGLTVQVSFLLLRRDWKSAWWRVGAMYCLVMPFLSFPVWEGYPGAVPRVLLPIAFAFNTQVVKSRWFWPLVILGNLSVWHGIPMIGVPFLKDIL